MASENKKEATFNPQRRLCPDGSCIGIIGSDGRCTVCGTGDEAAVLSPPAVPPADADPDESGFERDESDPGEPASEFDPKRRLCGDDACIGVIGEDNQCRLCGKPARP